MTILDANVLIFAHDAGAPQHSKARAWLDQLFSSSEIIGLPWLVIWAFLRITTNKRIQLTPRTPENALETVRDWLAQPRVAAIEPGPHHLAILQDLMLDSRISGPRVTDAVLAALAIEHQATLASTDGDFGRFPRLRWVNPLD